MQRPFAIFLLTLLVFGAHAQTATGMRLTYHV